MPPTATLLFGFTHRDMDAARRAVEQCLGIELAPHHSLYSGDHYRGEAGSGREVELRRNMDPLFDSKADAPEDRFAEPDFPDSHLLLYVHGQDLGATGQTLLRIAGIVELRMEEAE